MAKLGAIERELKVAAAGLEPAALRRRLADVAHAAKDRVIREQVGAGGFGPSVRTIVNGREGSEDQVEPPGPIVYLFDYIREIVFFALDAAKRMSPVLSGAYRDAWFVMVNGKQVEIDAISAGAEVIITNDRPYARKIHVGAMKVSVPPGIVERVRQVVLSRYGNAIKADVRFIVLEGGYVLKGRGRGKRARRGDVAAGKQMTYPSLVLRPR